MDNMNITTAQYIEITKPDGTTENCGVNATIDGQVMDVPLDTANRHYQAILDWVADGNTIQDAS